LWKCNGTLIWLYVSGSREKVKALWFNETTKKITTVPHHPGDIPEGTLHAILKQAGISPDDFLSQ